MRRSDVDTDITAVIEIGSRNRGIWPGLHHPKPATRTKWPAHAVHLYNSLQAQWVLSSLLLLTTFSASGSATGSTANGVCSALDGVSSAFGHTAHGVCEALDVAVSYRSCMCFCNLILLGKGVHTVVVSPSVLPRPPTALPAVSATPVTPFPTAAGTRSQRVLGNQRDGNH